MSVKKDTKKSFFEIRQLFLQFIFLETHHDNTYET